MPAIVKAFANPFPRACHVHTAATIPTTAPSRPIKPANTDIPPGGGPVGGSVTGVAEGGSGVGAADDATIVSLPSVTCCWHRIYL
jgi:hypothetical protein